MAEWKKVLMLLLFRCGIGRTVPSNYEVRLRNGSLAREGRVEIYYHGEWGTVCDDRWDLKDGHVVYHQLGYTNATYASSHASYGHGNGTIGLDEVKCKGSERTLHKCQHNRWGIHDCNHGEDAGVICKNSSAPSYSVRLAGDSSANQGRVEIQYDGIWGTVCDDHWDTLDANVLCRQLGYSHGMHMLQSYYGPGHGPIWLDNVRCRGTENRLADCRHSGWGIHNCDHSEDAGVVCTGRVLSATTPNSSINTSSFDEERNVDYPGEDDKNNGGAVIGGAAGGVIGALILSIVIAGLLLVWTKWKKKKNRPPAFLSTVSRQLSNAIYGEVGFEYADVGPAATDRTIKQQDAEYSYAVRGASEGAIYEETQIQDEEENIYMVPLSSKDGLYSQLDGIAMKLSRNNLSLGESLGSGQFGAVYRGIWRRGQEEVAVAVKTLKEGASEEDTVKFLQEAAIMGQFKHTNVITMYGVIKDEEPILLVLELLLNGDLRGHLLRSRSGDSVAMDDHTLLSYCRQVASGMVYLSNKSFVHRDLAARNILVTEDEICKIADFGMSRDLLYESFYTSHGGMIPVKWTAPEALHYRTYSIASDVWSFGVVMYEIWSVGHKPFETMNNNKVLSAISSGVRLAPPPGCPRKISRIMMECWHPESSHRPSFVDVSRQLSLPDSKLLVWCEEDIHTQAHTLGEQLHWGQHLYTDLQNKYIVE